MGLQVLAGFHSHLEHLIYTEIKWFLSVSEIKSIQNKISTKGRVREVRMRSRILPQIPSGKSTIESKTFKIRKQISKIRKESKYMHFKKEKKEKETIDPPNQY